MLVPRFAFICCCCCTHAVLAKKFGAQPNTLSHFHDDNLGMNSDAVGMDSRVQTAVKSIFRETLFLGQLYSFLSYP